MGTLKKIFFFQYRLRYRLRIYSRVNNVAEFIPSLRCLAPSGNTKFSQALSISCISFEWSGGRPLGLLSSASIASTFFKLEYSYLSGPHVPASIGAVSRFSELCECRSVENARRTINLSLNIFFKNYLRQLIRCCFCCFCNRKNIPERNSWGMSREWQSLAR